MAVLAPGIKIIQKIPRITYYQAYIMIITYMTYLTSHAIRKPIAIIEDVPTFMTCDNAKMYPKNSTDIDNHTDPIHEERCVSFIKYMDGMDYGKAHDTYVNMGKTSFLLSYAVFMFLAGEICERVDQRYFLTISCLLSGVFTFMFGLAYSAGITNIAYFVIIQVLVGASQSMLWPGLVSVMANWFGKGKRGLIFGIWNTHTSFGNIFGSFISGAFLTAQYNYDWGLSFVIPGLLMGCVGFLIFLTLIPSPDLVDGLQPPSQHDPDQENSDTEDKEDPEHKEETKPTEPTEQKAIGIIGALKIPGVVEFSLCLFFSKMVSYIFFYQLPHFIHSTSEMDSSNSATLSTFFDFGGAAGGILAGVLKDYSGMSGTTCSVMLAIAMPLFIIYKFVVMEWCPISGVIVGIPLDNSCYATNVAMLVLVGAFVNGPYALITTAVSAELGNHKSLKGSSKALATVTGIIDGMGSLGACLGPLIGQLLTPSQEGGSWDPFFYMLVAADFIALLMLTRIVKHEIQGLLKRRRNKQ